MGQRVFRKHRLKIAIAGLSLGVVGVTAVMAEDIWVGRTFVDVLGGKSSLYPVVIRAEKGEKLSVLDHDGKWLHVQYKDKTGYVMEDAMSYREVHTQFLSDIKGSTSSGTSAASSGKAFTPTDFALAKGLSEEPLKNLELTVASVVSPQSFDKFMADGKVGDDKPAPATQP